MKKIALIVFLLISTGVFAQFKYIQSGNYILRFDTTTTQYEPARDYANPDWNADLRLLSNDNLLVRTYNDNLWYFNANLTSANISQVGTTGIYLITTPTTISTTKGILVGMTYLEFSTNTHTPSRAGDGSYSIVRNSDSKTICQIYPNRGNAVFWHIAPSTINTLGSLIKRVIIP